MIPGSANPLLLKSAAAAAGALQIERSIRLNSADSAYFSRTPAVAGTRTTWTWSGWVKRSKIGNQRFSLFCAGNSGSDETEFYFEQSTGADALVFYYYPGSYTGFCKTLMLFRDTSAWYHIVLALDTTQGIASDRCKIYVNGVQQSTSFTSNFGPSATPHINSTSPHQLGRSPTEALPFDGYLANIHFIDGQALTPSSFTETDATTGQLIPKTYTGSYGTNGFNLLFADDSSNTASTLGKDYSGLGNNWTPVNLSVSTTGPIYSSTFTYSGTGSPAGVQDAAGAFLANSPTIPDSSQSSGRNAYVNHSGGTSFIQFNPSPAISGSNVRVFTYQPQGTSGADTWINVNGGSDLRPWRVSANYTGWSNSVAIPGGSLSSLRVSLSYGGGSVAPFYAVEVDGVVLRDALAQAIDSLVDSPTNYGTDTGVGGEVRGNYCTWNPLQLYTTGTAPNALTNGNLDWVRGGNQSYGALGTFAMVSGKWYWEGTAGADFGSNSAFAIAYQGISPSERDGQAGVSYGGMYQSNGTIRKNNTAVATYATYTTGDIIGIGYDADSRGLTFYKNGSSQGTITLDVSPTPYVPWVFLYDNTTSAASANFGQRAFAYQTPGTNRPAATFLALCTQNLPAPLVMKSNTVFDVITYTGTGAAQTLPNASSTPSTPLAFSPDLVWIKSRNRTWYHNLFDTIRGVGIGLSSNTTAADRALSTDLTAFTSDGFTLGAGLDTNESGSLYVGWAWDAGTSTDPNNTAGSITSQVRANPSAGFSITTFTSQSSGTATVGHGLGVAPEFFITKARNAANNWWCYHKSLATPQSNAIGLNLTNAALGSTTLWNNTAPTSSVISFGSDWVGSYTVVVYAFAPVVGHNSFGSYTGNGSTDGPFVYTGFRPKWVMIKGSSFATTGWAIYDAVRDTYNVTSNLLLAESSTAESSYPEIDLLSNGFKLRGTNPTWNYSGQTFIYAAFAEAPFNYSRAR